jgi:hypothetical protein
MTVQIWGSFNVEQSISGSLLPASAVPHTVDEKKPVPVAPGLATFFSWTLEDWEEFYLQSLIGQGPAAATYVVKLDGVEKLWVRSSTAEPTAKIDLGEAFLKVPAGTLLTVEVQHWLSNIRDFHVVLGGGLVTGNE